MFVPERGHSFRELHTTSRLTYNIYITKCFVNYNIF